MRGGHDILGGDIVKLEDIVDHILLDALDDALFLAHVHHHPDLFLGDVLLIRMGIHAEQADDQVGGYGQQLDKGARHHRNHPQNADEGKGQRFGFLHGDPFGYQLTEHQRKIGHDQG